MNILKIGMMTVWAMGLSMVFVSCTPENPCATTQDCEVNESCATVEGNGQCFPSCSADSPCEAGFTCTRNNNDDNPNVCLEINDDLEVGRDCVFDRQCTSGICLGDEEELVKVCFASCDVDADCSDGDRCYVFDGRKVCDQPDDDPKGAGEACTQPTQCESARCVELPHLNPTPDEGLCAIGCETQEECGDNETCAELIDGGRVCVELANTGEACVNPETCVAGSTCIVDDEQEDSPLICSAFCPDSGDCGPGFACVEQAIDNQPRVCVPVLEQKASGEACTDARECASGHCREFPEEVGGETLCADVCDGPGQCGDDGACWQADARAGVPSAPDVCGPRP